MRKLVMAMLLVLSIPVVGWPFNHDDTLAMRLVYQHRNDISLNYGKVINTYPSHLDGDEIMVLLVKWEPSFVIIDGVPTPEMQILWDMQLQGCVKSSLELVHRFTSLSGEHLACNWIIQIGNIQDYEGYWIRRNYLVWRLSSGTLMIGRTWYRLEASYAH